MPQLSVQHIIARVVGGAYLFDTPGARANYLERFDRALQGHDARIFCYSVMSNHVHLGVLTGAVPFSRVVSSVHSGFPQWLNRQLERPGPVFAGRFKNISFEPDRAGILLAYIHNNSTRAGVVSSPADCRWSSHRAYLGTGTAPSWLDVEGGSAISGFDADAAGRWGLAEFIESRKHNPRDPMMVGEVAVEDPKPPAIRGAVQRLSPHIQRSAELRWPLSVKPGVPHGLPWAGAPSRAIGAAATVLGIGRSELCGSGRGFELSRARDALLVAWTDRLARPTYELATMLGLSTSAASHAVKRGRQRAETLANAARVAAACRERAA